MGTADKYEGDTKRGVIYYTLGGLRVHIFEGYMDTQGEVLYTRRVGIYGGVVR